jgi:hypothetical protein
MLGTLLEAPVGNLVGDICEVFLAHVLWMMWHIWHGIILEAHTDCGTSSLCF